MFAVMKTGGKQYKVAKDDTLRVERLAAEAGETVQFNEILMLGGKDVVVGDPMIAGAAVQAEIVDQIKGEKVINFKKRRRKHSSQRTQGHRQNLPVIKVTEILEKGGDKSGVKAAIGTGAVSAAALAAMGASTATKAAPKKKAAKAEPKAAAPKAEPKKAAPKKAAAKKDEDRNEAAAETGSRPGNLLDGPKGDADDLKKISGVGPKLEGTLHEIGVYHFWQIAEWGKAEIDYMDDRLSFKGRIERDDWIGQAKDLAKGE